MNDPIVPRNATSRQPFTDHNVPEDDEPLPAICAAPCPRCTACVGWREPEVICPSCGTTWELTPAQADEFTLALPGIDPTLRLDLFLNAIDQESGPPPLSVAYPALLPSWHVLGRFPSLILAEVA